MKKALYIFFAVCILSSCKNDILNNPDKQPETNNEINVQNVNGILNFASVADFDDAVKMLTAPEANLKAFEEKLRFQSLKSFQDDIFTILNEIDDPDTYLGAIESYKDYIVYDADLDYAKPVIDIVGYASIANKDGWYMIEDVLYQITPNYLAIHSSGTRSAEPIKLSYKFEDLTESKTRGENWQTFVDGNMTYDGDRRVFTDFKTVMYWTLISSTGGEKTYSATYSFQCHIRAQKKNIWGNFKDYNTICEIQKLSFIFEIPGQSPEWWGQIALSDFVDCYQKKTFSSGKEVANYTHTFVSSRYYKVYDFYRPYALLLQYRAATRGTGNCGYEVNIGFNAYNMPAFPRCGNLP